MVMLRSLTARKMDGEQGRPRRMEGGSVDLFKSRLDNFWMFFDRTLWRYTNAVIIIIIIKYEYIVDLAGTGD